MDRRDFNDAPVGIALIGVNDDDYGRILRANRAFGGLVARTPEELDASSLCELIHPEDRAYALEEFATLISVRRGSREGEGRLVAKDGQIRWVRVHAGLFPTDGVARAVVMIHVTQVAELATQFGAPAR